MDRMTITEALAEIKLIDKRVEKKGEFIASYLVRQNALVDPLGDSGGSRKVLEQERQAIADLLARKVTIRRAIQEANVRTPVLANGETRSVADWLVWRREVAPAEQALLQGMKSRIDQARAQAAQRQLNVVAAERQPETPNDLVVNLSEKKLAERIEHIATVLATLDGQLSLKNATVLVEF